MDVVIMVLVAGVVALIAGTGLDLVLSEEWKVHRVLKALPAYEAEQAVEAEPLLGPLTSRVRTVASAAAQAVAGFMAPAEYKVRLRRRMVQAGVRRMSPEAMLTVKFLSILGGLVALGPLALFMFIVGHRIISFGLVLLIPASFFAADLWLYHKASSRQHAMRIALPDMLDMLTISVEAGLGLDAALGKLVQNTKGPLSEEFGIVLNEVQAGMSRKDAFRNLAARADVGELSSFISAMVQADVFGVAVSQVLRAQADEMRTKRRQHAEELAQKAPVKLVFPLVLCILPATLIVIVGPAIISIGRMFGAQL